MLYSEDFVECAEVEMDAYRVTPEPDSRIKHIMEKRILWSKQYVTQQTVADR